MTELAPEPAHKTPQNSTQASLQALDYEQKVHEGGSSAESDPEIHSDEEGGLDDAHDSDWSKGGDYTPEKADDRFRSRSGSDEEEDELQRLQYLENQVEQL